MLARLGLLTLGILTIGTIVGTARGDTVVQFTLNGAVTGSNGSIINSYQVQLFDNEAPLTVANFLHYLNDHAYDNTIIHGVVNSSIMQGGGFLPQLGVVGTQTVVTALNPLTTYGSVQNEFSSNRSNVAGTLAMAKLDNDPNSAADQWFVNLVDNSADLDGKNGGYTVFGQVLGEGMKLIQSVGGLPTYDLNATYDPSGAYGHPFSQVPMFNNGSTFVMVTSAGTGGYSLTLNNSGRPSSIDVTTGGQLIGVPVVIYNDLQINTSGTGTSSLTVSRSISEVGGSKQLTKTGTGTLTLVGSSTYTGGTLVSAGTLQLGDGTAANGSIAGNVIDDAALIIANPADQIFTGNISGSGALTKAGTATLTLEGSNTYNGNTTVSAGMLKTLAISGSGSTIVAPSAELQATFIQQHELTIAAGGKVILGGVTTPALAAKLIGNAAGNVAGGSSSGDAAAVPEPAAWILLLSAACCSRMFTRRRKPR